MAPSPRWADLVPELLCYIADHIADLKSYASARCVCAAWRRALAPPSPALLVFAADAAARCIRPYAAYLCTRRTPFEFAAAIASGSRCVGASGDGWLALAVAVVFSSCSPSTSCASSPSRTEAVLVSLVNPAAAAEIRLPPLVYQSRHWPSSVSKAVFAPRPARDDFAAAAICDADRVAYVTAGARRWAVVAPLRLAVRDYLADLVYADDGNVYCLTKCGEVHVLRLPERRRRRNPPPPANGIVDEAAAAGPSSKPEPELFLLRPPPPPAESERTVHLRRRPLPAEFERTIDHRQRNSRKRRYEEAFCPSDNKVLLLPDERQGLDLNDPATIEPLLSAEANNHPATVFAPPYYYDAVSPITGAKNLVFCEGSLYQVWRNKSCAVSLNLPSSSGGHQRCRVAENEVLLFRYYPRRQPQCWDVVKDLGGHSFFVGRNNAVSMYAKGVPGLKGNCVYWIGGSGRDQAMVFDMESGKSTPCSSGFLPGQPRSTIICWYFLSDVCTEHQQQLQQ